MRAVAARSAILLCLCAVLAPGRAAACRYNVRDIGFVDIEGAAYTLYGCVSRDTPENAIVQLREAAGAALLDSNIRLEILDLDQATEHPARTHLAENPPASLPAAVLLSPDGQALSVEIAMPAEPLRTTAAAALDALVSSSKRDEIVRVTAESFAAVLLIEGTDPAQTRRAREEIEDVIAFVQAGMRDLPKAIARPPALVVLEASACAAEGVLLWSLGLDATPAAAPRAAVIYGKARWIGPVMVGEEISSRNLGRILSIVGADCECGLDVSWTRGTQLPLRWSDEVHQRAVQSLGFDPESPMVKFEIARIVRRSTATLDPAMGYEEVEVQLDAAPEIAAGAAGPAPERHAAASVPDSVPAPALDAAARVEPKAAEGTVKKVGFALAGLALAIAIAGLALARRPRGG